MLPAWHGETSESLKDINRFKFTHNVHLTWIVIVLLCRSFFILTDNFNTYFYWLNYYLLYRSILAEILEFYLFRFEQPSVRLWSLLFNVLLVPGGSLRPCTICSMLSLRHCSVIYQEKPFTYNVTLKRVRVTLVAVGKKQVLNYECMFVVACKFVSACAVLYCHLWPVWLYHNFPHYLINGTTFGKTLLNLKCVLISCTIFVWNIF